MSTQRLQDAARHALAGVAGDALQGEIDAVSFTVTGAGGREMVSLRLTETGIAAACTCGAASTGAPSCEHAKLALSALAGEPPEGAIKPVIVDRVTMMLEPTVRVGSLSPTARAAVAAQEASAPLLSALEDVIASVLRSGTNAGISAAVAEALERVAQLTPPNKAPAARVFIGALSSALDARNAGECVRALEGARAILSSLRGEPMGESERLRLATFLGDSTGTERISERSLIELAREWRRGVERAGIERRYLLDLGDGQIYREDGPVTDPPPSLGPCPRAIQVGLAQIEAGAAPRRLRLFQYTTTPVFEASLLDQVGQWAERSFAAVKERYVRYVTAFSGVAEPLALVSMAELRSGVSPTIVDEAEQSIGLLAPEGVLECLQSTLRDAEPLWVFGRLVPEGDELSLWPLAMCVRRLGQPRYAQL